MKNFGKDYKLCEGKEKRKTKKELKIFFKNNLKKNKNIESLLP